VVLGPRRRNGRGKEPITENTVFRIASITKTLTAIAVMQLREQGLVYLDNRPTSTCERSGWCRRRPDCGRPPCDTSLPTPPGSVSGVGYPTCSNRELVQASGQDVLVRRPSDYRKGLPVEVEPGTKRQ
jgi:hypothetical protein